MVDAETELVSISVVGMSLNAVYRLPDATKADIQNLTDARVAVAQKSASKVCVAPFASILINEFGATYTYAYYSKNKEYLFDLKLDRTTCAQGYRWQ